ncbi:PREDICTED: zinc carboxypeptidase-like [Papilio polytes]|uniref:zinc carboxypeptidase-like n=1 Tax=Papilio polytes TaxID=76194 RepID=UPI0006767E2E|nr:PREDICTED: zinc carboxypeptidase-like [Papilio polytes]
MPIEQAVSLTMKYYLLLFFTALVCVASEIVDNYKSYKDYKYYEVHGTQHGIKRLTEALKKNDASLVYSSSKDVAEFVIAPSLVSFFMKIVTEENLMYNILYEDISNIIQLERSILPGKGDFSWTSYYDIDDINDYLTNMSKTYPSWSELIAGGQSYQGRTILGLRINTSQRNAPKPVVFIESGIHAREWIAPATTTYFINELLTSNDSNITHIRDQFDWRIFPSCNPDGYHHSYTVDRFWRKTLSKSSNRCIGADPNRNWDYNWGQESSSDDPCDYQIYAGTKPFSEIETRSLSSYIKGIDNLLAYISLHSNAEILLVPYSDSNQHIDNYDDLVKIGNVSLDYGHEKSKQKRYRGPATAAEILYKASGGSMDWVRSVLNVPLVYTYELRGRLFYWSPEKIPEQGDEVTQMLLGLMTEACKFGYC